MGMANSRKQLSNKSQSNDNTGRNPKRNEENTNREPQKSTILDSVSNASLEHSKSSSRHDDSQLYWVNFLSSVAIYTFIGAIFVHLVFLIYSYRYHIERLKSDSEQLRPLTPSMYEYFHYELQCPECITARGLVVNTSVYVR